MMALDLKFVTFSHRVFDTFFVGDITEYYVSESLTEADLEEIFDPFLLKAIFTIVYFYCYVFQNRAVNDKTEYQESREKFRSYISHVCNSEHWFGEQTIFERCFSTISFALICSVCLEEPFREIKGYAYVSWAEYFEEYTEEFYNKGGWTKLRHLAKSYNNVWEFLLVVNPETDSLDILNKISKSVENYVYFRLMSVDILKAENDDEYNAHESRALEKLKMQYDDKHKTLASLWIKFKVQNFNAQGFDASCIQPPKTTSEVTCLLRALRNLCAGLRDEEKNKKESYDFHKNSNSNEATGLELLKPIIKNVHLQNTVVEEECEKNSSFENFTGGENDGTKNASRISSSAGEILRKSNEWKTVLRKGRYKVSDEKASFSKEMGELSPNSIINNSLRNSTVEDLEDGSIENFTGENDGTDNVPHTSSMDGPVLRKSNKRKRSKKLRKSKKRKPKKNRKKKGLKNLDKNSELDEASSQASLNSNLNNISQLNTADEEEHGNEDSTENVEEDENDSTGKEHKYCFLN